MGSARGAGGDEQRRELRPARGAKQRGEGDRGKPEGACQFLGGFQRGEAFTAQAQIVRGFTGVQMSHFRLGDAQTRWLRDQLAAAKAAREPRPLVFMHAFPEDLHRRLIWMWSSTAA